ncbi:MAG: YfiT family bacillithiol transferase [Alphaproteobacteria bacterium]
MTPDPSFPIGRFDRQATITAALRQSAIADIAALPGRLRVAVAGLTDAQLDTPYRDGGWTVRQLVHHVADSHMNGYIRLKLALTEENPTIKPYEQDPWAHLPDSRLPIAVSLPIIDGVHARWTVLWQSLDEATLQRTFTHPEMGRLTLDRHLQLYAWHSRHHTAHATALRATKGW